MSLATSLLHSTNVDDQDYIDMEISCFSPKATRDFEFQMTFSSSIDEKETTPSPADELFYKGKLLPLHLPPRLQMVQKLLQTSKNPFENASNETLAKTPMIFTRNAKSDTNTPFSISPPESCRASTELNNVDEYFFDWSKEFTSTFIAENPKKPWSKKLKLIKQSPLAQKLKASRDYIKSFFTKPEEDTKTKECFTKGIKAVKRSKGDYPTIASVIAEENVVTHRKSFSGAIKRHCTTKSSSSMSSSTSSSTSSSFSLKGFCDLQLLKRSSSAISEIECSIEGAIEHCKKSQQVLSNSMKDSSEVGICSISIKNNVVSENKER